MNSKSNRAHRLAWRVACLATCWVLAGCAAVDHPPHGLETVPGVQGAPGAAPQPSPQERPLRPELTAPGVTALAVGPLPLLGPTPAQGAPESRTSTGDATAAAPAQPAPNAGPEDLWARMRSGFALAELPPNEVEPLARALAGKRGYLDRVFGRGRLYLYDIVQALEANRMPLELALLPVVESAFMAQARSVAQAEGLWQFIVPTAQRFDLRRQMFQDDRLAVRPATVAAMRYLSELAQRYNGDYHLALAAYNCGEGCVDRAIEKARRAGKPASFRHLALPNETRRYVPQLLAIRAIVLNPQRYGVVLPPLANQPYFESVKIPRDMDLHTAAQLADMGMDDFMALNPQHKRPLIVAATSPHVLLPVEKVPLFSERLAALPPERLTAWTTLKTPQTQRVDLIAKKLGTSEATLRAANGIRPGMLVGAGSTLLVPRPDGHDQDIPAATAESARLLQHPEKQRITVTVRKGETLAQIAKHHHVNTEDIRRWNPKTGKTLKAGQRLLLWVPATKEMHPERMAVSNAAQPPVAEKL